jgi:hypothetical protein
VAVAWWSPRLAVSNPTLPFRRRRPLTQIKSAAFPAERL